MFGLGITQIISYIAALGLAAIVPGPGMTALITRSISNGAVTGFTLLGGLIIGDLIYLSIAIFGLAIIAHTYTSIFTFINWAAALYLGILAWQFWHHQPKAIKLEKKATTQELTVAWFSGLTLTLGNPKTIAFYLAILPLIISLDNVSIKIWSLVLIPVTVLVLFIVGSIYILSALKVRQFLTSVKSQRLLFRSAGLIMLIAAVGMVAKTL
jgi:threonine/homoserine/homoserine lactone efflux protein